MSGLSHAKEYFMQAGKENFREFERQFFPGKQTGGDPDYVFDIIYLIVLILLATLVIIIQAFFVLILWNFVIPRLQKGEKMTWLMAASLLIMVRIVFF